MKTTLDLPDDLLIEAKATAARRRTTLRAVVEHALRREIFFSDESTNDEDAYIGISPEGLPYFKKPGKRKVTSEMIYDLMEEEGI